MAEEPDWSPVQSAAAEIPADGDVTAAGVARRVGEHVHGAGPRLTKDIRLCCYCDTPVHLTQHGWQPLSASHSLALLARTGGPSGTLRAQAELAERWRWWHWLRYPVQGWRQWQSRHI